jgi:hypothetical protein
MRSVWLSLLVIAVGCSKSNRPTTVEPTEVLAQQVEEERQSSAYAPKVKGQIDDLAAPTAVIMR